MMHMFASANQGMPAEQPPLQPSGQPVPAYAGSAPAQYPLPPQGAVHQPQPIQASQARKADKPKPKHKFGGNMAFMPTSVMK
jgi:hypothetical protein